MKPRPRGLARHAYLDGELDPLAAARFERHLGACPRCRARDGGDREVRDLFDRSGLYAPATTVLRARIEWSLDGASRDVNGARRPRGARVPAWAALAAALVAALLAAAVVRPVLDRPRRESALVAQLVDAHVRSLQDGHLTDVASSDRHSVRPWFAGRLEFAPLVGDLAAESFPLIGGRLDVVGGRPVAALAYSRHRHVVNVFVWPGAPQGPVDRGTLRAYEWRRSARDGLTVWAVSDASAEDVETLVRALTR